MRDSAMSVDDMEESVIQESIPPTEKAAAIVISRASAALSFEDHSKSDTSPQPVHELIKDEASTLPRRIGTGSVLSKSGSGSTKFDSLFAELETFEVGACHTLDLEDQVKEKQPVSDTASITPTLVSDTAKLNIADGDIETPEFDKDGLQLTKHELRRRSSMSKPMRRVDSGQADERGHQRKENILVRKLSFVKSRTIGTNTPSTAVALSSTEPLSEGSMADFQTTKSNSTGASNTQTARFIPQRPLSATPMKWSQQAGGGKVTTPRDSAAFFAEGKRNLEEPSSISLDRRSINSGSSSEGGIKGGHSNSAEEEDGKTRKGFGMATLTRSLSFLKRRNSAQRFSE
ncbi:hypothetical protein BDR26DRAFT_859597 [Obelidium mucronatum]|nr:hypothetical protein BDR26DRAFT_859597 [Obelidium mucronatum]